MTMNTPYLLTDTSAQSAVNTAVLTGGTTGLPSDVSSQGTVFADQFVARTAFSGPLASGSAISGGAITGTTLTLNGKGPLTLVSASSTTIVATTVVATKSTTTTFTDNALLAGDLIEVGPSNLSAGVVLQGICSTNSTLTFIYSNVSAANAAQVAINCRYLAWRF